MANNKLSDLNDHLFQSLERLNDDELMKSDGESEIERAKAISGIAKNIVENAKTVLMAAKIQSELPMNADISLKRLTE